MKFDSDLSSSAFGGANTEEWFSPRRFALLLGTLFFISYPGVILGAGTFVIRDFGFFGYPLAHYHREAFWRGEIPLWNPLNNCGLPFLAEWNTMTLYPLSLIYLIFPLSWSLGIFCLVHLFIGAMGMYFLARKWTGNSFAGSIAGIVFGFNGLSQNCLMWPNNVAALGWMPWVVLVCEAALIIGRRRVLIAMLIGALQMLTGGPEIISLTWLVIFCFAVTLVAAKKVSWSRAALRFSVMIAGIAGLCAAQLLPFLQLLAASQRGSSFGNSVWSMPPWGWAQFLVPLYGSYQNDFGGKPGGLFFQYGQAWTTSYYAGVTTIILLFVAIIKIRDARVWALFGLFVSSIVIALGESGPIYLFIAKVFPQLGFLRFPIKFVLLAIFCAPLLAAYSIAALFQADQKESRKVAACVWATAFVIIILIGGVVWFNFKYPFDDRSVGVVTSNAVARVAGVAIGVLVLAHLRSKIPTRRAAMLGYFLLVGFWIDFTTHTARQNPTMSRAAYRPGMAKKALGLQPPPIHGRARAMLSPYALTALKYAFSQSLMDDYLRGRLGFFSNCNLLDEVSKVDGFFSLYIREADEVISALSKDPSAPLMDFLGVAHLSAPGKYFEWTNRPSFMPFVSIGQTPIYLLKAAILKAVFEPTFAPRQTVYLLGLPVPEGNTADWVRGTAIITSINAHRLDIDVNVSGETFLVISQAYYPCWRAFVDSKRIEVKRANYAFQALLVPAGSHHVRLEYQDRAFWWGVLISIASAMACSVFWWFLRPRHQYSKRPGGNSGPM